MSVRNVTYLVLLFLTTLLGTGQFSMAAMAWLSPLLALLFLYSEHGKPARRLRWLFLVSWAALSVAWYGATPIWGLAHLIFMAFNAAVGMLIYILVWWLWQPREQGFISTLIFPAIYVSVELIALAGSPFGSFGAEAYSQYGFLAFLQLISLTGLLGVSFIMAWTASVLLWCYFRRFKGSSVHRKPLSLMFVLLAVFSWGFWQLSQPTNSREIMVAGVTAESVNVHQYMDWFQSELPTFEAQTRRLHSSYLEASKEVAEAGAQLIVWPELAGIGTFESVDRLIAEASEFATRHEVHLVIPSLSLDPAGLEVALNQAHLIDDQGNVLLKHVKFGGNFIEGTQPGRRELSWIDSDLGRIGLLICWDADFPNVVREAGKSGLDYLIVVAKDWSGIDPLHGHMAVFRAIENRVSLVRQADGGLSVFTDSRGRVLAQARGTEQSLMVAVPAGAESSLYARLGDLPGKFALLATILLVVRKTVMTWQNRQ